MKAFLTLPSFKRNSEVLRRMSEFLLKSSYFQEIYQKVGEEAVLECAKFMQYLCLPLKTFNYHCETEPDKFYLILSGNVRLYKSGQLGTEDLHKGMSFGESFFKTQNEISQVACLGYAHFAVLDSIDFKKIHDHLLESKFNIVLSFLSTIPVLNGLSKRYIRKILGCFKVKVFKRKERVFSEKDPCDFVYFIDEGEFLLSKKKQVLTTSPLRNCHSPTRHLASTDLVANHKLAILSKGAMMGDEDLILKNNSRTFSCECYSVTGKVLMISSSDFMENLGRTHDVFELLKSRVLTREENREIIEKKNTDLLKLRIPTPRPPIPPLVSPRSTKKHSYQVRTWNSSSRKLKILFPCHLIL
jgi:CRP-like cAMP-binding protein